MSAQQMGLHEYEWAIDQARAAHGQVKKWIIYAGEQLEIAGMPKENISTKLRRDLPEFSADYITQICSQKGWTDRRFSPFEEQVAQSQPLDSSSSSLPGSSNNNTATTHDRLEEVLVVGGRRQQLAQEQPDKAACTRENQPYIEHLQHKIEFLQDVQRKLRDRPFLSLLDRRQYEEYLLLSDSAERLAREAWDGRQTIPVATQFYLVQIIASSTIKHGASEYLAKVKELFGLTSKQVTKTLKGIVREVHYIYEPTNQMEALLDGFYGKPCEACGSWRIRWENGVCRCFACDHEYRAKAEKLPLARPTYYNLDFLDSYEPSQAS
jgi:hypothetical protein